jgi:hypothetical protein
MPETPGVPKPIAFVKQGPVGVKTGGATEVIRTPSPTDGLAAVLGASASFGVGYEAPGESYDRVFPVKGLALPAAVIGTSATAGVTVLAVFERAYSEPYNPGPGGGPKLTMGQQGPSGVTMVSKLDSMGPTVAVGMPEPTQYHVTLHVAANAARGPFTAQVVLHQATGDPQTMTLQGSIGGITGVLKGAPPTFPEGQGGAFTMTVMNDSAADVMVTAVPGDGLRFSFDAQQVALKAHASADVVLAVKSSPQVSPGVQGVAVSLSALDGLMKTVVSLPCVVGEPLSSLSVGTVSLNNWITGTTQAVDISLQTTGPDDASPKWTLTNLPKGVTVDSASFPTKVVHGATRLSLQMHMDLLTSAEPYASTVNLSCILYDGAVTLKCDVVLPPIQLARHVWNDTALTLNLNYAQLEVRPTGDCGLSAMTGNDDAIVKGLAASKDWVLIAGLKNARKAYLVWNNGPTPLTKNGWIGNGRNSPYVANNWQAVISDGAEFHGASPGAAVLGNDAARKAWLLKTYGWTEF